MTTRNTSFGTIKILLEKQGKVKSELLTFHKEGRGHAHKEWEICYITEGKGIIYYGEEVIQVKEGDVVKIPPNINHWMKPLPFMEILLVYSKSE